MRKINIDDFERLMMHHFKNKSDFSKNLGISRTHLDKILLGKCQIGIKTFRKLSKLCKGKNVDVEDLLIPEPMRNIREVIVTKGGDLIAHITSYNAIVAKGYEIECVPDNSD